MTALLLPRRLANQPQGGLTVNWNAPIAKGLVQAHVLGNNKGYDAATARLTAVIGTKTVADSVGRAAGFGATLGTSTTGDKIPTALTGALTERSYFYRFKRNGAGGGGLGRLFDKTNGSTGQFLYWRNGGSVIAYNCYTSGAERTFDIPGTGAALQWIDVAVVHTVSGGVSTCTAYVNGVLAVGPTNLAGTTLDDAASTVLTIGNRNSDNTRTWDGLIECGYTWNRALHAAEVRSLSRDRYQLFKEPARQLFVTAPSAAPDAPTIGSAVAGNGSATVTFSPPASNGGSPITGYTVTSSPGGLTASGDGSPITVTGLTNGTEYTFTVTATNGVGTSAASDPSNPVTPQVTVTLTLKSRAGVAAASLTGLRWAWWDETNLSLIGAPLHQGSVEATDADGVIVIDLPTSTKVSGQAGLLAIYDSADINRYFGITAVS